MFYSCHGPCMFDKAGKCTVTMRLWEVVSVLWLTGCDWFAVHYSRTHFHIQRRHHCILGAVVRRVCSQVGCVMFEPGSKHTTALVWWRTSTGRGQWLHQQSGVHLWHEDWTAAAQVRHVACCSVVQSHQLACAPCGLRGCNNGAASFPGRMSYKATKPGLVCLSYLSMLSQNCGSLGPLFVYC